MVYPRHAWMAGWCAPDNEMVLSVSLKVHLQKGSPLNCILRYCSQTQKLVSLVYLDKK